MSLPKEQISFLLEAYTSKTATAEQEQELMEWIQEAREDSELRNYMQSLWDKYEPEMHSGKVNWDSMFENIMQKEKVHSIVPQTKRIHWTRIAAAVIVLLLLSVGGYFYINNNNSQRQIAKTEIKTDVKAPISSKAMITLASGKQIILDSVSNGTLAKEGGVNISKLEDGQIAYTGTSNEVQYNTLTNPKGSKAITLTLADGSKVWLNVASSITYPTAFAGKERKVQITGEAYFEVAHIASMPFVVEKNDVSVQVLGTHFNVNTYDDESAIKITLLEGSVKVSKGNKTSLIKPGQQAQIASEINIVNADVDEVMAWKNGLFSFDKVDLQTILRQLTKWYDVDVEYQGNIPKQTFGGDMQRTLSLAQVLKVLEKSEVHFKIEGKKIIVMP